LLLAIRLQLLLLLTLGVHLLLLHILLLLHKKLLLLQLLLLLVKDLLLIHVGLPSWHLLILGLLHQVRLQDLVLLLLVLPQLLYELNGQWVLGQPKGGNRVRNISGAHGVLLGLLLLDQQIEVVLLVLRGHRLHVLNQTKDYLVVLLLV
jgi:hypothetical protein